MMSLHTPGLEQLRVSDLHAFYGESHILHGIDLQVHCGELITLLGRNGSGRSTTLRAIMNMAGRRTGSIVVNGNETMNLAAHLIPRLGVGYCPEERGILPASTLRKTSCCHPRCAATG